MPVSRKRKKARKSNQKPRSQTYALSAGLGDQREQAATIAGFVEYRQHLDERRASLALDD